MEETEGGPSAAQKALEGCRFPLCDRIYLIDRPGLGRASGRSSGLLIHSQEIIGDFTGKLVDKRAASNASLSWRSRRSRSRSSPRSILEIGDDRLRQLIHKGVATLTAAMMVVMVMMSQRSIDAGGLRRVSRLRRLTRIQLNGLLGNRCSVT
jgi:hypothetical protein